MDKIENVSDFQVKNDFVAYLNTGSLFSKTLYLDDEKVPIPNVSSFNLYGEKLIFSTWKPDSYILDTQSRTCELFAEGASCSTDSLYENKVIVSRKINGKFSHFLYDFSKNVYTEIKGEFVGKVLQGKRITTEKNNTSVILMDIEGRTLWEYSLSSQYNWSTKGSGEKIPPRQATTTQIIGVYEDTLWLAVNSDNVVLLGLDLQSGREKYRINEPEHYPAGWSQEEKKQRKPFGNGTQIDVEKGVLFGGFNHYYGEVNLKGPVPAYQIFDFQESSEQHQLRMNQFGAWEGGHIYFWEGVSNNRFGIFSREKKAVVWSGLIEEAENTMPAIRKVDYSHGKLYVLDHHYTLHIFEQEA